MKCKVTFYDGVGSQANREFDNITECQMWAMRWWSEFAKHCLMSMKPKFTIEIPKEADSYYISELEMVEEGHWNMSWGEKVYPSKTNVRPRKCISFLHKQQLYS